MKTKYFILAAIAAVGLASCADDVFVGDNSPNVVEETTVDDNGITFGFDFKNVTRADIVGSGAADLLGNGFYVIGTKGAQEETSPSTNLVFDNYLVHYGINTAGTTESNTANWEYVGVTPGSGSYTNWVKLSSLANQTIKYWDYSTTQYDFHAFSTGAKKAVKDKTTSTIGDGEINVTKSLYGSGLAGGATAYTFIVPTAEALKGAYVTDITTVEKANYGKEVKLTFKNLGSKIRLALYETVPGYAVKDVKFYRVDGTSTDLGTATKYDAAYLISADATNGFFTKGTVAVSFPKVGSNNSANANYKKASVSVTPVAPTDPGAVVKYQEFGTLHNFAASKEGSEADGNYIGRTLPTATFAGKEEVGYYQVVFPVTAGSALTLRVDYTLVSTDGSGETIKVYGAKAVVPSTYTTWQPNYAYTYIFKISDNTNGWTDTGATKAGLFPITFDAVVAEIKDPSGEQTTITTVATPSITTYQQNHNKTTDEYSKATGKKIYVQVMDNSTTPASLKKNLNDVDPYVMSKLYSVTSTGAPISEATVMDALQNRTTAIAGTDDATLTGRNGITLTKNTNISNTVETIVNGADDKPIDLRDKNGSGEPVENSGKGKAAEIDITKLSAGTYAYVYDYGDVAKTTTTFYQPKTVAVNDVIGDGVKYITLAKLGTIVATTSSEAANDDYIYFSKTTDGVTTTYSYYSVDGKDGNLPDGLLKVAKATDLLTGDGSTTKVVAGDFVFDIYIRNTGTYAVKIIKVV